MNPSFVALPRLKPCLELYELYETGPKLFIFACDIHRTVYNVLKIERDTDELCVTEDSRDYTRVQMSMLIDSLRGAFSKNNYFRLLTSGHGIMGFIRFTKGYNIVMITKRAKAAQIGPHIIYEVKQTEIKSLTERTGVSSSEESRYLGIFNNLETKSDFFFSYTYDLSHSLQFNCQRLAKGHLQDPDLASYDDMFVYNSFLLQDLQRSLGDCNSKWVLPCIHGSIRQKTINCGVHTIRLILLARRSRYFAGMRYHKRGISDEGHVANHIETEQIVYDVSSLSRCGTLGWFSSHVQMRGSVPLYWYQPKIGEQTNLRPPIKFGREDIWYKASKLHFAHLFASYGTPIICLNLLKYKEKKEKETPLRKEFEAAVDALNKALPSQAQLKYIRFDFRHATTSKDGLSNDMAAIAEECFDLTGMFRTGGPNCVTTEQLGVVRSNCVDCLDRTNWAQYYIALHALYKQLDYIGIGPDHMFAVAHKKAADELLDMYTRVGNQLAQQYGGSKAVSLGLFNRGSLSDIGTSLQRIWSNFFKDKKKQESLNVFLGNYTTYVLKGGELDEEELGFETPSSFSIGVQLAFQRPKMLFASSMPQIVDDKDEDTPSLTLSGSLKLPKRGSNASFSALQTPADRKEECSPMASPSSDPATSALARREMEIWDIENDHYLHTRSNFKSNFSPSPLFLSPDRWWEAPLEMYKARRLTTQTPSYPTRHEVRGNNLYHCFLQLHQSCRASFASDGVLRCPSRSPMHDPCLATSHGRSANLHNSHRTCGTLPRSPECLSFDNNGSFAGQDPHDATSGSSVICERFRSVPEFEEASLDCVYPVLSYPTVIDLQPQEPEEADWSNDFHPYVASEGLQKSLEGKFLPESPYLFDGKIKSYGSEKTPVFAQVRYLEDTTDGGEREKQLEEYYSIPSVILNTALSGLYGWKEHFKEAVKSSYYGEKRDREQHGAWLSTYTVRELVNSRDSDDTVALEYEKEFAERKDFAPKSIGEYMRYVEQPQRDLRSAFRGIPSECSCIPAYQQYVSLPKRTEEEVCQTEATALEHNKYYPKLDSGTAIQELSDIFNPFLERPVPPHRLEDAMRTLSQKMRSNMRILNRVRPPTPEKRDYSEGSTPLLKKAFLARQAVDYVLFNIPQLGLSPDYFLSAPNPREVVVRFLDLLLQSGVFNRMQTGLSDHPSSNTPYKPFKDSFKVFRFEADEPLRVLNASHIFLNTPDDPIVLSCRLLRLALELYRQFQEGKDESQDTLTYLGTDRYMNYKELSGKLAGLNLLDITSDKKKFVFWVNVYNALSIDAQFTVGCAMMQFLHQSVFLRTSCYCVGGYVFSLEDMHHGILRANRRAAADNSTFTPLDDSLRTVPAKRVKNRLFRPFRSGDCRLPYMVKEVDLRVHFALYINEDLLDAEDPDLLPKKKPALFSNSSFGPLRESPKGLSHFSEIFGSSRETIPTQPSEDASSEPSSEEDEQPTIKPSRPLALVETIFSTKRQLPRTTMSTVLDANTMESQLKDIISQKMNIQVDFENAVLYLPDVFFSYPEDFGTEASQLLNSALQLASGAMRKRLLRFKEAHTTFTCAQASKGFQ